VRAFIETIVERYGIDERDRCSQTFDLTFDLSVFDMFVAWERGACVCCPSERELMAPGSFVRRAGLTVWFSVPSTGAFMRKLGMLKPDSYPSLRWSLFCGEPLPDEVARAWAAAAPNSTVENLYGPTEATIACTVQAFDPARPRELSVNGIVPIGEPLGDMTALVVDEDLREVAPGGDGELLMAGPQVTPGYWHDPERTAAAFVVPPGRDAVHYRTGDRVRRPTNGGPLAYLGRVDHQIKVLGHRVELGEIEAALREESGIDAAIAVGWPLTPSGAGGIVAFLGDLEVDVDALRSALSARLPDYMVPRKVVLLEELPLNANGKFDRRALLASLEPPPASTARVA
jgi:non-ribosomal peptide synthetase component F